MADERISEKKSGGILDRLRAWLGSFSPRIRTLNVCAIVFASLLAIVSLFMVRAALETYDRLKHESNEYMTCSEAAENLQSASDYLTNQSRMYVSTGRRNYLDAYLAEMQIIKRREKAVETLKNSMRSESSVKELESADDYSNALAQVELYAMRLRAEAEGFERIPLILQQVEISAEDSSLEPKEKARLAQTLLFNDSYLNRKLEIVSRVSACTSNLMDELKSAEQATDERLTQLLSTIHLVIILLVAIVACVILENIFLILWPLETFADRVTNGLPLVRQGARELDAVVNAYNAMFEENRQRTEQLQQMAETDVLTGLLNRSSYDALLEHHESDIALILVDVDLFKEVNDTYGHEMGDRVLKRVANVLSSSVRSSDFAFRLGGDEFGLVMTDMRPDLRPVVERKVAEIAELLRDEEDGVPGVTLSVGVAFSETAGNGEALYRAADQALYLVKRNGRNGLAFFGDAQDETLLPKEELPRS